MRHQCIVTGILVGLFCLLGALALFSKDDERPNQPQNETVIPLPPS